MHALSTGIDAHRQGVDEQAQGAVRPGTALQSTQQHATEDHVVAARQYRQHPGPSQVIETGRAYTQFPGLGAQAQGQFARDTCQGFCHRIGVGLYTGNAIRQRRLIDVVQPLTEESLVCLGITARSRLRHVITVWRANGQCCALPGQNSLDFALHERQRDMVHHDVMEPEQPDPALIGLIIGINPTDQRCLAQVDATLASVESLQQLLRHVTLARVRRKVFD